MQSLLHITKPFHSKSCEKVKAEKLSIIEPVPSVNLSVGVIAYNGELVYKRLSSTQHTREERDLSYTVPFKTAQYTHLRMQSLMPVMDTTVFRYTMTTSTTHLLHLGDTGDDNTRCYNQIIANPINQNMDDTLIQHIPSKKISSESPDGKIYVVVIGLHPIQRYLHLPKIQGYNLQRIGHYFPSFTQCNSADFACCTPRSNIFVQNKIFCLFFDCNRILLSQTSAPVMPTTSLIYFFQCIYADYFQYQEQNYLVIFGQY